MTVNTEAKDFLKVKAKKSIKVKVSAKKIRGYTLGWLLPIILLIVWEATARLNLIDTYVFPAPTTIFSKIIEMGNEGVLWGHIGITLFRVFVGFFAGTIAALVLGSIVGYFKWFEELLDPLIQAFRSIPSLAWVPLFILWMGIGESSKVVLIAVGVFFPVYLNNMAAAVPLDIPHFRKPVAINMLGCPEVISPI